MFLSIVAALPFFSVYAAEAQFPNFSYNGSGYIFVNHSNKRWQVVGEANEVNRGTFQNLLDRQNDLAYLNGLYEISLTDSANIPTDVLKRLLALPMSNLAYINLSGAVNADQLCEGLSQNKTLRNLRVIFLDKSDVSIQGLKSILGIEIPDNSDPEDHQYYLVRDMKARSMMYDTPIASLQISIKDVPGLNYQEVKSLNSRLSAKKWPVFYLNNDAPEMAPLLFQFRS